MSDTTPAVGPFPGNLPRLEHLLIELHDFDDDVRINAAKSLIEFHDPKARSALVGRLKDRNAEVRWSAIRALVAIKDRSVGPLLCPMLHDSSSQVRADAARALGELPYATAASNLVESVDDPDPEVSRQAGISLGKLKDNGSIQALVSRLSTFTCIIPKPQTTARILALAQMGTMVINPIMKSIENSPDIALSRLYDVREYRCRPETIAFFDDRVQVLLGLGPEVIDIVGQQYESIKKSWYACGVRLVIVQYLAQIANPRTQRYLCQATTDDSVSIRWFAVEGLEKLPLTPDITKTLVNVLQNDSTVDLRWRAMKALSALKSKEVIPTLIWVFQNDKIVDLRLRAIEELLDLEVEASEAISSLIQVLKNDKNADLRKSVAKALGRLKAVMAISTLCDCALKESDPSMAQEAIRALGEIGDVKAIRTLFKILINDNYDAPKRQCAALALGSIQSSESVSLLVSVLGSDGDPAVRTAAAESLGKLGTIAAAALGPLEIVVNRNDENIAVIQAAKSALSKIH